MKSIASLRGEIINRLWNNGTNDPKRDSAFHKWLEELIKRDREELLSEIKSKVNEQDTLYDTIEMLKEFKIK